MEAKTNDGMTGTKIGKPVDTMRLANDKRYRCVSIKANGKGEIASKADATVVGILMNSFNKPNVPSQVCVAGIVNCIAGAEITAGTAVVSDTEGRVVAATPESKNIIGIAMSSAAAANDFVDILLK